MRLDLLLIRRHPTLSRRKARDVIEKGQVSVGGERVREAGRDVPESAVVVFDPNRKALPKARIDLPVLYEDEHVLVVDKPAGLLSVPTGPGAGEEDTALGRVQEYARRKDPRAGYAERVHRLDRDTSGALAFALSREARAGLIRLFRDHRIERRYLAIAAGHPRDESGTVDAPVRDAWESGRRGVAAPGEPARPARTHYHLRERLPGASLLELALETGRQHQVRVHLAHLGLPIVGDPVYGAAARRGRPLARRPMLHAARLAFDHPVTGVRVVASSPPPPDFEHVLATLRRHTPRGERPCTEDTNGTDRRARHAAPPRSAPQRAPSPATRAARSSPRPPSPRRRSPGRPQRRPRALRSGR
jgi:23S rRNA pseudouridine1911/1915/1917 synthase